MCETGINRLYPSWVTVKYKMPCILGAVNFLSVLLCGMALAGFLLKLFHQCGVASPIQLLSEPITDQTSSISDLLLYRLCDFQTLPLQYRCSRGEDDIAVYIAFMSPKIFEKYLSI